MATIFGNLSGYTLNQFDSFSSFSGVVPALEYWVIFPTDVSGVLQAPYAVSAGGSVIFPHVTYVFRFIQVPPINAL